MKSKPFLDFDWEAIGLFFVSLDLFISLTQLIPGYIRLSEFLITYYYASSIYPDKIFFVLDKIEIVQDKDFVQG